MGTGVAVACVNKEAFLVCVRGTKEMQLTYWSG